MEYIVVAFRSREQTVKFSNFLNKNYISNRIINTPKEALVGCGLSVRVGVNSLSNAYRAVRAVSFSSFAGIFLVKELNGKRFVKTI